MTESFDLEPTGGGVMSRCTYTDRHLVIPDDLKFEDWMELVGRLQHIQEASAWWLGDALVYGEKRFGESYSQIAEATNRSVATVSLAVNVAKTFPPDERAWSLPYTHYAEVSYNEPETAGQLLDAAEKEGWSAQELRRHARNAKIAKNLPPAATEEKKRIHVAYADWGAVSFRLKEYADNHPVVAPYVGAFIEQMDCLLQEGMRNGKIEMEGAGA